MPMIQISCPNTKLCEQHARLAKLERLCYLGTTDQRNSILECLDNIDIWNDYQV